VIPVSRLGNKYQEFLEAMGTMPHSRLRYFDNDFLECLTVCPWYAVPLWWLPIAFVFFVFALNNGIRLIELPIFLVSGFLGWAFVEYMLHKYVFHMKSKTFLTNALHFLVHGYHHLLPMDHLRLVFPPTFGSIIGVAIYGSLRLCFPLPVAQAQFAGMIIGYVFYDCTHYFVHHKQMNIPFFREMKKHHLYHHYNNHESNYGISMKLYDYLFGTYASSSTSPLSQRSATSHFGGKFQKA
jgi:dihydroceramide fatty acyl 2-hydroxylase